MPSSTYIPALPVRLDTFRAGEIDERAIDFSRDLTPYNDTLASVVAVTVVQRDNGATLGPLDLTIITDDQLHLPKIDTSGYIAGWWQTSSPAITSNGITIDYKITVTAATVDGRTIICDAMQLVVPERG